MEAAFFDLDKTIIARSSPLALGRSFYREGLINRSFMLKSVYAQLMLQRMGANEEKMERMRTEAAEAIKEMAARDGIDLSRSYAYTDSITDLPMLEAVGRPVVINPDKELRRLGVERGWQVEAFRDPVPMRSRLPQLRNPQLSTTERASVAGVISLALLAWWYTRRTPRR